MIINLFSQGIARLAVPIFFFISGFLFFQKVSEFDIETYKNKIEKRIRTLLIPYLLWNGLLLLGLTGLFFAGHPLSILKDGLHWNVLFQTFVGSLHETGAFPLIYPLWFIRDLFCVCLISPVIYIFIRKAKFVYILLLGILWVLGREIPVLGFYCLSMSALFFFSLGGYFSLLNLSVKEILHHLRFAGIVYPIMLILDLYYHNLLLHNLAILNGIILVLWGTEYLVRCSNIVPIPFLSSATFFVFAIHEPILLTTIRKICIWILPITNTQVLVISYFASIILTVLVALGIYAALRRTCPKFVTLFTGGR